MTRSAGHASIARLQGRGYNLVVLAMAITALSVMVAASLPVWSHASQRQKEEELIFRGLQYAEAIRVYQARFGRPPTRLEELIETSPRCIRQLWKDPMTEDGEWELIFGQAQQAAQNNNRRRARPGQPGANRDLSQADFSRGNRQVTRLSPGETTPRDTGLTGERRQTGPIIGVFSSLDEESIRSYKGATAYNEWQFVVDDLPVPAVNLSNGQLPRANAAWVGKPFPEGIEPQSGSGPGGATDEGDDEEANPFSSNRNPLDRNTFGRSRSGSRSRDN